MQQKAKPLTKDVFMQRCQGTIIRAQDARAIVRNECFTSCTSRNEQMLFVRQFLIENCFISANAKLMSSIYCITEGNFRKILCNSKKQKMPNGRPLKIDEAKEDELISTILSKKSDGNYMTTSQILQYVENQYNISLTRGWVRSFINRHSSLIISSMIYPQEEPRLKIPRSQLIEYIDLVDKVITMSPAELIYNMDESGLSDWEERKPKTVVIPKELENVKLHYPVDRGIRHITLLVTISAGGDAYFPLIVTTDPKAESIFDLGIRRNIDLIIKIRTSSYMTKEIFNEHIVNRFIPQVESDRNLQGCEEKPAILFFDNCSSHIDENLFKLLANHNILVITYPPHTSHIFQVLDRLLFGVLKTKKRYIPKNSDIPSKNDHLYRVFRAYEMSTCSTTIRSSFQHTGFDYYSVNDVNYIKQNRQRIEKFDEFKEIFDLNYSVDDLSGRRKSQKWGWINKHFFSEEFQKNVENK